MKQSSGYPHPILEGRYWRMPDNELVPNIFGGDNDGDDDNVTLTKADHKKLLDNAAEARKDAGKYRTQLRELEEKVDKLGEIDVDEYNKLQAAAKDAETAKLEEEGKYKELLEEQSRRHEKALEKANTTSSTWKDRYESIMVDNALLSSAKDAVNPAAAVTLVRSQHKFIISEDGSIEIKKGDEVLLADDGKPVAPAALMVSYLEANPYLLNAQNNGGANTPPKSGDKQPVQDNLKPVDKIAAGLAEMQK